MKHLRVEINGIELVNGDFAEVSFTDSSTGIKVEGKAARTSGSGGGNGMSLLELLTKGAKAKPEESLAVKDEPPQASLQKINEKTLSAPTVGSEEVLAVSSASPRPM